MGFAILEKGRCRIVGHNPLSTNLEINSSADDISIIFEDKNERGYLTSNRNGGRGKTDIYSFSLPPLVLFVQGVVKDMNTKVILPGSKITMTGSDGSSVEAIADDAGGYKFTLAPNTTYQIQGSSEMTHKNQIGLEVLKYFASEKHKITSLMTRKNKTKQTKEKQKIESNTTQSLVV